MNRFNLRDYKYNPIDKWNSCGNSRTKNRRFEI